MYRWLALILATFTAVAAPVVPSPGAQPKILRLSLPAALNTLDPQGAYDESSLQVISGVYDTLLTYDPFKTAPCEVIPCILEGLPTLEAGPDGRVSYLFRLKEGVKFHDAPCFPGGKGRDVSAADVHFTFQRICDPKVDSPFHTVLAEQIKGMKEARQSAVKSGLLNYDKHKIAGIEIIDARSFRIHLMRPWPQLLYWLAHTATAPVAREAVEYYDGKTGPPFAIHPVGTGAFRLDFEHSDPRTILRLARHERYATMQFPKGGWPADRAEVCAPLAGKALPLLDAVEFHIIESTQAQWKRFQEGDLDELPLPRDARNLVLNGDGELLGAQSRRGMMLERLVEPSTFFTIFNCADPIVGKNKKLRQALASAYDAKAYTRIFLGGNAPVANQLIPPGVNGHDPMRRSPYPYDLDRAKKLLSEAGYPEGKDPKTGKPLELAIDAVTSSSDHRDRAEFEKISMEKLGVRVTLIENTFRELLEKKEKGQFQLASGAGWWADYPDAENFYALFYSKHVPPGAHNESRYNNPEFDVLFEKMSTMSDGPDRLNIINKMADILAEDCPVIPTFHRARLLLSTPWARRTHLHHFQHGFMYLTVDPERREAMRKEWTR